MILESGRDGPRGSAGRREAVRTSGALALFLSSTAPCDINAAWAVLFPWWRPAPSALARITQNELELESGLRASRPQIPNLVLLLIHVEHSLDAS